MKTLPYLILHNSIKYNLFYGSKKEAVIMLCPHLPIHSNIANYIVYVLFYLLLILFLVLVDIFHHLVMKKRKLFLMVRLLLTVFCCTTDVFQGKTHTYTGRSLESQSLLRKVYNLLNWSFQRGVGCLITKNLEVRGVVWIFSGSILNFPMKLNYSKHVYSQNTAHFKYSK